MCYWRLTILVIFTLLITPDSEAQQQLFKNYTVNDGLVANPIRRIFQDKKGFLWIATWEGLSKYDGHTFTNFTKANGLSHNLVNDIYESANGQFYVALNNGTINNVSDDNKITIAGSSATAVNSITQTPWQKVIATTDKKGLLEFDNGNFISPTQDFPLTTFSHLTIISDTAFIAVGENYIRVFNQHYHLIAATNKGFNQFSEINIYQDLKKRIWVGSSSGLKLITALPQKNLPLVFTTLPIPFNIPVLLNSKINNILESDDGTMWFATTNGIIKVNTDGSYQVITVKDGLSSNIVNTIFQDKEKNIWFGTEVGLSKLVTQSGIRLYPIENGVASSDNSYLLYPFNKNNFLVSTSNGVEVFNKLTGSFTPVTNSRNKQIVYVVPNIVPSLFIGAFNISTLDTARLQFNKTSPLPVSSANRVVIDKAGNFFSGDFNHLFFGSGKTQRIILNFRIASLLIDKSGDLWVGSWENGLYHLKYNAADSGLQILSTNHFLPKENIRSLFEDSKGTIWAGTRYNGLFQLIKNDKENNYSISNFNQSNGLSSDFIKEIREDSNGNFWVAFYNGIDKLIKKGNNYRVFNFSRVNNYFARVVGMETDANNTIWLATTEGLVKIKDAEMEQSIPLPVYITKVFSPDSSYSLQSKNILLNYRQNQLQFNFSAPSFINEKQVLYSYRLSGSSVDEWSSASNQHTVSYASLSPGNYIFEVRTLGWNGNWGKPASFEFIIRPPFWQTGWFIALLIFSVALLTYLFIQWRIKNIKTIATEKLKVQQLSASQYKNKLELEQIINYFSTSLIDKTTVEDVLWDVARNLIGKLGFVDCIIYLWNSDKTKMVQKAGYGPKGSIEEINKQYFDVIPGQGVVGHVLQTKEPVIISDTSKDSRYRADEMIRLSELTVPVIYNNELIGVIDSEHHERNFYTQQHLQIINTIATLMANKIKAIEAEQSLRQANIEMYSMDEQLSKAKLEALRSQMNPHFIFNCLNSIDALIHSNDKYNATVYLNKFAKLLRNILDSSKQNTVTFSKDIETLKLYIQLEELRNEKKFTTQINIDPEIYDSDYRVPPLIVQPFVENAIIHGLKNKEGEDGILVIEIKKIGNKIKYLISDNGIGREAAEKINQNKESHYGMQMSYDRIKLFNKEEAVSVEIHDLLTNNVPSGTEVIIYLNII